MIYKVWVCLEAEYDDIEADSEDEIVNKKIDKNKIKYPVDKARGKSDKYTSYLEKKLYKEVYDEDI